MVKLTPREQEVLGLVKQGYTNREIAEKLFNSIGTVKNHIFNMLNKTGARNRTELSNMVVE